MSKYDPALLEKAVRLVRQADSYSHGIEAVFDSLERAPWWFLVPAGYRFRDGEPIRFEEGNRSEESIAVGLFTVPHKGTFFMDTRWTPPPAPLAVGDVIEALEDLERLPVGAGFVDQDRDLWQVDRDECGETIGASMAGGSWEGFTAVIYYAPLTVVYLPESGATE